MIRVALPVRVRVADALDVEEHADGAAKLDRPVVVAHRAAVGCPQTTSAAAVLITTGLALSTGDQSHDCRGSTEISCVFSGGDLPTVGTVNETWTPSPHHGTTNATGARARRRTDDQAIRPEKVAAVQSFRSRPVRATES
jgi:hypothetical protein